MDLRLTVPWSTKSDANEPLHESYVNVVERPKGYEDMNLIFKLADCRGGIDWRGTTSVEEGAVVED